MLHKQWGLDPEKRFAPMLTDFLHSQSLGLPSSPCVTCTWSNHIHYVLTAVSRTLSSHNLQRFNTRARDITSTTWEPPIQSTDTSPCQLNLEGAVCLPLLSLLSRLLCLLSFVHRTRISMVRIEEMARAWLSSWLRSRSWKGSTGSGKTAEA